MFSIKEYTAIFNYLMKNSNVPKQPVPGEEDPPARPNPDDSKDVSLSDRTKTLAQSNVTISDNFISKTIDLPAFFTEDYTRLRNLIVNWYASHRTIVETEKNASDIYSLPSSELDTLFYSFGFNIGTALRNMDEDSKTAFFKDLVNLYKRKGTPQSLIDALRYFDVNAIDMCEYWLQYNEQGDLVFRPRIIDRTPHSVVGSTIADLPYSITSQDPHWFLSRAKINELLEQNKIKLPSKTAYIGVRPSFDLTEYIPYIAYIARYRDDQYRNWLVKTPEERLADRNITTFVEYNGSLSFIELYVGTIYAFSQYYHTYRPFEILDILWEDATSTIWDPEFTAYWQGKDSEQYASIYFLNPDYFPRRYDDSHDPPLIIPINDSTSVSDVILRYWDEVNCVGLDPVTRETLNERQEFVFNKYSIQISEDFISTCNLGDLLYEMHPEFKDFIDFELDQIDAENIVRSLVNSLSNWIRVEFQRGWAIANQPYRDYYPLGQFILDFGSFEQGYVTDIIDFFKPYRARLSFIQKIIKLGNRLQDNILIEDNFEVNILIDTFQDIKFWWRIDGETLRAETDRESYYSVPHYLQSPTFDYPGTDLINFTESYIGNAVLELSEDNSEAWLGENGLEFQAINPNPPLVLVMMWDWESEVLWDEDITMDWGAPPVLTEVRPQTPLFEGGDAIRGRIGFWISKQDEPEDYSDIVFWHRVMSPLSFPTDRESYYSVPSIDQAGLGGELEDIYYYDEESGYSYLYLSGYNMAAILEDEEINSFSFSGIDPIITEEIPYEIPYTPSLDTSSVLSGRLGYWFKKEGESQPYLILEETDPQPGAELVPVEQTVHAIFNYSVNSNAIEGNISLEDSNEDIVACDIYPYPENARIVVIAPFEELNYRETYTLKCTTGLRSIENYPLDRDYVIPFTTLIRLKLIAMDPLPSSYSVPIDKVITTRFNFDVDEDTIEGNVFLYNNADEMIPTTIYRSAPNYITIAPEEELIFGELYRINLLQGLTSYDGYELNRVYNLYFNTTNTPVMSITSMNPDFTPSDRLPLDTTSVIVAFNHNIDVNSLNTFYYISPYGDIPIECKPITILKDGNDVPISFDVNDNVLTINILEEITPNSYYTIRFIGRFSFSSPSGMVYFDGVKSIEEYLLYPYSLYYWMLSENAPKIVLIDTNIPYGSVNVGSTQDIVLTFDREFDATAILSLAGIYDGSEFQYRTRIYSRNGFIPPGQSFLRSWVHPSSICKWRYDTIGNGQSTLTFYLNTDDYPTITWPANDYFILNLDPQYFRIHPSLLPSDYPGINNLHFTNRSSFLQIASSSIIDRSYDVPLNTNSWSIEFNQSVNSSQTSNLTVTGSSGSPSINDRILTVIYTTPLQIGTFHRVMFLRNFKSSDGDVLLLPPVSVYSNGTDMAGTVSTNSTYFYSLYDELSIISIYMIDSTTGDYYFLTGGETDIPRNGTYYARFTYPPGVDLTTINPTSVILSDSSGNIIPCVLDHGNISPSELGGYALIYIRPGGSKYQAILSLRGNTLYTITFTTDIKTPLGHSLNEEYNISFRTAINLEDYMSFLPEVSYPYDGEMKIDPNSIFNLHFDKFIDEETIIDNVQLLDGTSIVSIDVYTEFPDYLREIFIAPIEPLDLDKEYTIVLKSGLSGEECQLIDDIYITFFTEDGYMRLTDSYPNNGDIHVPFNESYFFIFDYNIDSESLPGNVELLLDTTSIDISVEISEFDSNIITIMPNDNLLPLTDYTFVFKTGLTGEGRSLLEQYNISFTTITDAQYCTLLETYPEDLATEIPIDSNLTFTFDLPMTVSGLDDRGIELRESGSSLKLGEYTVDGNVITMNPWTDMEANRTYVVTLTPWSEINTHGVRSLLDSPDIKPLDKVYTFSFSTTTDVMEVIDSYPETFDFTQTVSVNPNITIEFTKNIDEDTIIISGEDKTVELLQFPHDPFDFYDVTEVPISADVNGRVLTITSISDLTSNYFYRLNISNEVKSVDDFELEGGYQIIFRVSSLVNLTLLSTIPESGTETNFKIDGSQGIIATFDDDVKPDQDISIVILDNTLKEYYVTIETEDNVVTVYPDVIWANLPPETEMTLVFRGLTSYEIGFTSIDGNTLDREYSITFTTESADNYFWLSSSSPYDNQAGVSRNVTPTLTFDANIDPTSVVYGSTESVRLFTGYTFISGSINVNNNVITITPSSSLNAYSYYTITITRDVKDIYGKSLPRNTFFTFRTGAS